jgi:hypothetical protein
VCVSASIRRNGNGQVTVCVSVLASDAMVMGTSLCVCVSASIRRNGNGWGTVCVSASIKCNGH